MPDVVEILVPASPAVVETLVPGAASIVEVEVAGAQGPEGPSPLASRYGAETVSPVAGVLTLDLTDATSFLVNMTGSVTSIVFTGEPAADRAQGVFLWFQQDGTGNRTVAGSAWPAGSISPLGITPTLSTAANALDLVVLNVADASLGIVAVTVVARDYRAF